MRFRISTVIEVDPTKWAAEYGMDPTEIDEIKQDIKMYFEDLVDQTVDEQIERLGVK